MVLTWRRIIIIIIISRGPLADLIVSGLAQLGGVRQSADGVAQRLT